IQNSGVRRKENLSKRVAALSFWILDSDSWILFFIVPRSSFSLARLRRRCCARLWLRRSVGVSWWRSRHRTRFDGWLALILFFHTGRQSSGSHCLLRFLDRKIFRNLDMRALHYLINDLLLFILFDRSLCYVARRLRRSHRI